ncbi:glutathion S-transferase II, GST-II, putative [Paecilomyces variotii No. 5]|uniref:glutathione transferase n=1 Tax=Byssochlamys spectabilis (strain No. 5 / NBRC 109023) TaxID=1356009 RepID=V5FI43_BYSSN|nr:glutathion S-transferase II, GST-II, putative [Paecilomyces variotii No. 5]
MGRFEQWVNVEVTNFDALARALQMRLIFDPLKSKPANEELVSNILEALDNKLEVYETAILPKQAYMAGNEFSLVDIFYMPLTAYLFTMGHGDLVDRRPLLKMWWEKVSSRPSWKAFGVNAQVMVA